MSKITLNEEQFKELIKEVTNRVLKEQSLLLEYYARVGFLDKLEVCVFTDDGGNIPHIHVRDITTRGHEFETCVRLDTNQYFLHGKHQDTFNNRGCKAINEFMNAPSKNKKYQNNYEYAVDMWNDNNSNATIEPQFDTNGKIIVPDYNQLNG